MLTLVLIEEATTTIPTTTRVIVTTMRLTVTTTFPLGPHSNTIPDYIF